jgi:hypothetical protein
MNEGQCIFYFLLLSDNQDESVEYNVLLKGVEQYGKNTATSGSESGHVHSALESMDFDEMESVMWKKVTASFLTVAVTRKFVIL